MSAEFTHALARFFIGGTIVSLFAVLAEMFRPKSFAGLFGAAPSIALATLGLTIASEGPQYAATEARSMILGAAAFLCYAAATTWLLWRYKPRTLTATLSLMPIWFGVSFALWLAVR
ncbi:DUF3147 family protein [Occallatibacter savannae]|uniref:DUF3147 family protein n=1 Tax=Occallatibacter savannae TaxID=1002691 RepID=UPI000D690C42|nr:DUF3147 family protein [Occallatibacter savannae]